MKWQRKANESCNLSKNDSAMNFSLNASQTQGSKTPMKSFNKSTSSKTPTQMASSLSSLCTPGKSKITPGNGKKTPSSCDRGDRFIPSRSGTKFELGHFLLNKKEEENEAVMSPSQKEFQRVMGQNLNGGSLAEAKIMVYSTKPPAAPEGFQNNLKVLYSQGKSTGSCHKVTRHIPQAPERILDAPDMKDDYYLNLLDWSPNNHLAVCLGSTVYVWSADSGDIVQLMQMEAPEDYVSSVSWVKEGHILAVGTSAAEVQLWDVEKKKRLRVMAGHSSRVGALSWNCHLLSSGSRCGTVKHHDVRVPNHQVATLSAHSQEVCGLRWSPDGKYLASGGNDNLLNIWPVTSGQLSTTLRPLYTFSQHHAAVKALAWCPWQPSLLASGGGTADRHIRFWNCNTGSCVTSVDTKSQVCGILWSSQYRELISGHGFAQNQLTIWKYPTLTRVADLTGHTSRVLHMAMSPDGNTVVSAAADETLRLWKCFAIDPRKAKDSSKVSARKGSSELFSRQRLR